MMAEGVFHIKARKCKRCGRLLTSSGAIEKGYGRLCEMKARAERNVKSPVLGQMTFMEYLDGISEEEADNREDGDRHGIS